MSDQITTAFIDQFRSNISMLLQQRGSALRDAVTVDTAIKGKKSFVDQIGATAAVDVTSRHGDSPLVNTPHSRRMLTMTSTDWGDLIDDFDQVRMLIDPESSYAQNAAWAFGRRLDDHIVTAATGNASTGVDGSTTTSFPAAGTIAVDYVESGGAADSNLTVAKLRRASELLSANEVPMEDRHIAVTASNLMALLRDTAVTSSDFNSVKALVNAELNTFMGFQFHRTQRIAEVTATNVRSCLAFHKTGIMLGMGSEIRTRVEERADKRFSTYVYLSMDAGATRLEEGKVIEILADEDL